MLELGTSRISNTEAEKKINESGNGNGNGPLLSGNGNDLLFTLKRARL